MQLIIPHYGVGVLYQVTSVMGLTEMIVVQCCVSKLNNYRIFTAFVEVCRLLFHFSTRLRLFCRPYTGVVDVIACSNQLELSTKFCYIV